MELLEKLEEECIIEVDYAVYIGAKQEIMEHFGPV